MAGGAQRGAIDVGPKTLIGKSGLPIDEASRMKRAEEMGMTTDAYHGTDKEFPAFKRKLNDIGIHFGTAGQASDRLNYLTSPTRRSRTFEGSSILPVRLRLRNPLRMDDIGAWDADNLEYGLERAGIPKDRIQLALRSSSSPTGKIKALQNLLQKMGYDGIIS